MQILIERRLGTAPYWMPVERGWAEPNNEVVTVRSPTAGDLRTHRGVMLVDTLLASTALEQCFVATEHAVAADTISLLTMITSSRPDEIDEASVGAEGVSLTGRAIAEIVIPEFYGITIRDWLEGRVEIGPETVRVTEDEAALLPTATETDFHEDLGRAWFLMTNTPFVSHVCLVDEETVDGDPEGVRTAMKDLREMREAAGRQRRLLRRNIARDHHIDRDLVVDVFDGLHFELTSRGVEGLSTLYRQTGVLRRIGPLEERLLP